MKGFISVSVIPELSDCEYTRIFNVNCIHSFFSFIEAGKIRGKLVMNEGNGREAYTTLETAEELVAKVEEATGNKKLDEMLEEVKKMAKKWQNWEL